MNELTTNFYIQMLLTAIFTGIFAYILFKKIRLVKWERAPKETKSWMKKNQQKITIAVNILITVGLVGSWLTIAINTYYMISGNYEVVSLPSLFSNVTEVYSSGDNTSDSGNRSLAIIITSVLRQLNIRI